MKRVKVQLSKENSVVIEAQSFEEEDMIDHLKMLQKKLKGEKLCKKRIYRK